MNRNRIIGFAVSAAVLCLLAFMLYSLFEIVPETEYLPPSREARVNEYLALDRWLESYGIPVRVEGRVDFSVVLRAGEKRIFIQSSLFHWESAQTEYLTRWVEEGGRLFIALDNIREMEREGFRFLEDEFGIKALARRGEYHYDPESPSFDRSVSFEYSQEISLEEFQEDRPSEVLLSLEDLGGNVKLIQVRRGKGTLTVTGEPRFLQSVNISEAPNARLAWALFAEDRNEGGWLFIRGKAKVSGLLGSLFRQGNLTVLLVSLLVLLSIGFWSVLPTFGFVRGEDAKPGKPLRERFLAEGYFLKKYGALDSYLAVYAKEIKRRGKLADENDGLQAHIDRKPVAFREFPELVKKYMAMLER